MTKVNDLHQKWMKNKEYRKAYKELAPEFALAHAVIEARVTAGLTQEQLATANGHYPIRHSQARKRADPAIHTDA